MSEDQIIRKINIVWWSSIGNVIIYFVATLLFKPLPFGEGFKVFIDIEKASIVYSMLILSIVSIIIPFTLLGRKYIKKMFDSNKIIRFSFIRLAFMEIPIILGTMVFTLIHSYEIYIIFFTISLIGLIIIKGENNFYFDILKSNKVKV